MDIEYLVAADFNRAWLNFELDLPLKPGPNGEPNPFYVDRPGNPAAELEDALLAPYWQPPKFFFSGHRGCGKSTELLRLAANPDIKAKFYPVHFSIRDEADINDLDFRDILLAIGGRLYRDYVTGGGRLPDQLLKELDRWRGTIEAQVVTRLGGPVTEGELGGKLTWFFGEVSGKMKLEPTTRQEIRRVVERNITGLIDVINLISTTILAQEKRLPLVLIDDLDKPDLDKAVEIFHGHNQIMLQPSCAIVYTISSALFYSPEFYAIRNRAVFLPNVKLHARCDPTTRYQDGYATLGEFVYRRMLPNLITEDARDAAIAHSGGVFREMGRVMRAAISRARRRKAAQVESVDVAWAVTEIRNEYRRILTEDDLRYLGEVARHNRLESHARLRPLMQILAVLEYRNAENWCDVHPAIVELLEEQNGHGSAV